MRRIFPITVLAVIGVALTALVGGRLVAAPMGSVVTYQGHLDQTVVSGGGGISQQTSSTPVTGVCDFRFSLWDALTNGDLVSTTQTVSAVSVSNGLFTVTLDFGAGAFNGEARWLEIGVRTNGIGSFTELTPRQEVPLMPYALYAAEAGNTAVTNVSGGIYSNITLTGSSTIPYATTAGGGWPTQWPIVAITNANWATNTAAGIAAAGGLTNNETGVTLTGTFTNGAYYGNGSGLTNIPATGISGTAVTNAQLVSATNNVLTLASNSFDAVGAALNATNAFALGELSSATNKLLVTVNANILTATNNFLPAATNVANASALAATNAFASGELASATNAVLTVATNAANLIGSLPQYPTVQIATNAPFTNAVLISPDGTNRAWGSASSISGLGSAALLSSNAFQSASATLTALSNGNGFGLTNLNATNLVGTLSNYTATTPFSVILIPDSQYMSDAGTSGSNLWCQTCQWISSQVANLNIKAVLSLGDITQDDTTNEYLTMLAGFNLLTNQIPVLPCVGNHDGVTSEDPSYINFNSIFTQNWITNQHGWSGGFYKNNASQNSYLVFTNAGITYVCLTTEWGGGQTAATAANIMMWSSNVCSAYPVNTSYFIFTTHSFLQMTGLRDQYGDPYDPPSWQGTGLTGEQMWGFWKQIPNLGLIANGHFLTNPNGQPDQLPYEARRIDAGTAGNWINQLICNHQQQSPPDSYLKILTFYPGQNVIYASTLDISATSTNYVAADAYTMPIRLDANVPTYSVVAGVGTYLTTNSGSLIALNVQTNLTGAISMTNAGNQFIGAFTGNGGGLTNLPAAQLTGTISLTNENPNVVTNTATGVTLTGSFTGNGSGLTNLSATQLAGGTLPLAQLPGVVITNNESSVTLSGTFNGAYYGDGTGITNLMANATNLTATATNAIGNNGGSGTNVTLYGTVTSTNLNAAIQSATNNALALASNSFYGIGNVSNFQNFLQVSNIVTQQGSTIPISMTNTANSFVGTNLILGGALTLPAMNNSNALVLSGTTPIMLDYGSGNFFAGPGAGNLTMTGTNNTGIGYQALAANTSGYGNEAIGNQALFNNTTGYKNSAVGYYALYNNTSGHDNTANGYNALYSNTSGYDNVAVGYYALYFNNGYDNDALGTQALYNNTSGIGNVANGPFALLDNTSGSYNSAIGFQTLYVNTTGAYNTAIGNQALFNNTKAKYSTAIGNQALYANTTGSNNIALGNAAGYNQTTGSYNIYIGNVGVAGESNMIYIGTAGIQTNTIIAGIITGNGGGLTNILATGITATNSPVNGYALRYTNGTFYWAP